MSDPVMRPPPPGGLFGTRHAAGEVAARSSGGKRARVIELLRQRPRALFELAAAMDILDHQLSGTLTGMAADGLIERTGETRPTPRNCPADVWRLATRTAAAVLDHDRLADALGYPGTLVIDNATWHRQPREPADVDIPGIDYTRAHGVRELWRVALFECPGCGGRLLYHADPPGKRFTCPRPTCARTWFPMIVSEPGQPPMLALVMRYL